MPFCSYRLPFCPFAKLFSFSISGLRLLIVIAFTNEFFAVVFALQLFLLSVLAGLFLWSVFDRFGFFFFFFFFSHQFLICIFLREYIRMRTRIHLYFRFAFFLYIYFLSSFGLFFVVVLAFVRVRVA